MVGIQNAYNCDAGTTDDRTSNSVLRRLIQCAHCIQHRMLFNVRCAVAHVK